MGARDIFSSVAIVAAIFGDAYMDVYRAFREKRLTALQTEKNSDNRKREALRLFC